MNVKGTQIVPRVTIPIGKSPINGNSDSHLPKRYQQYTVTFGLTYLLFSPLYEDL